MAFNNGTLKVLETFKDSMLPVMRKGEIEALDHIIEDVKLALSAPAPVPAEEVVDYKMALSAVEVFAKESTEEISMPMFVRFCKDRLSAPGKEKGWNIGC